MRIDNSVNLGELNGVLGSAMGARATGKAVSDTSLRQVAADFESLFVNQMFQAMRRTVPESKLFAQNSGEKMFRDMLDQQWAANLANQGGLGIGEMLYHQMVGNEDLVGPEKAQDAAPAATAQTDAINPGAPGMEMGK
jgi:flagellar protein FlgJ